ncbi:MAG: hypothetical protein AAGD96_03915 [Chloroflexota bacterium]
MGKNLFKNKLNRFYAVVIILILGFVITACTSPEIEPLPLIPTRAVVADLAPETATPTPRTDLPPTFTPEASEFEVATPVGDFVVTPRPTNTPFPTLIPTATRTPIPTQTPIPTNTPIPTAIPTASPTASFLDPVSSLPSGTDLLFNGDFEEGHYNQDGIAELQLPNNWALEWEVGGTGFGDEVWDIWVRPEVRVLSKAEVPSNEHSDFFEDGDHTVKIFKGYGAVQFRLTQTIQLPPGRYQFTAHVYPDMIDDYTADGDKVFADDYRAAEISFLANGNQSNWEFVPIGEQNRFAYTFDISQDEPVLVGISGRGRFAVRNNGWFIDGLSVVKID